MGRTSSQTLLSVMSTWQLKIVMMAALTPWKSANITDLYLTPYPLQSLLLSSYQHITG